MPKCGEKGHRTKSGGLCQQNIAATAKGCLWHTATAEERTKIAMKGAFSASLKQVLPEEIEIGELRTAEDAKAVVRTMLPWVLRKPIERWRAAEARGWLSLFVQIEQVEANHKLADAVLTAQHGGQSLVFLQQFLEGGPDGRRKLPSRVKVLPEETEQAS